MVENDESSNGWLGLSSMFRRQAIWVSHWRAPSPRPHKPKMKVAMKVPRCYLQVGPTLRKSTIEMGVSIGTSLNSIVYFPARHVTDDTGG